MMSTHKICLHLIEWVNSTFSSNKQFISSCTIQSTLCSKSKQKFGINEEPYSSSSLMNLLADCHHP